MKETTSGGRPPGKKYEHKLFSYADEAGYRRAQEIARRRNCSVAAVIRALIDEEADRLGVTAPEPASTAEGAGWERRFRELLAKAQSSDMGDLTPEDLEREVTLARDEVRAELRESAGARRR